MVESISALKVTADAAAWIWKNKKVIVDVTKWLFQGREKRPFLILGAGGVGKTTTAKLLQGDFDNVKRIPGVYEESIGLESYTLEDDPHVSIVVAPGQVRHRDSTWTELETGISSDKYRGVILVNSYGYHSLGEISYKSHRLYKGNTDEFLQKYLEDRRQEEVEVLTRLAPHISTVKKKFWLFNLVTKADLWWPKYESVKRHYELGEFGSGLVNLEGRLGKGNFRHERALGSLVISNFVTGRGELLAQTASGYDQNLQTDFFKRFWAALTALKKWEGT